MKLNFTKKRLLVISIAVLVLLCIFIALIYFISIKPAEEAIEEARKAQEGEVLDYESYTYRIGQKKDGTRVLSAPVNFTAAAVFREDIYIASGGGLIRLKAGDGVTSDAMGVSARTENRNLKNTESRNFGEFRKNNNEAVINSLDVDDMLKSSGMFTSADGLGENHIIDLSVWREQLVMIHPTAGITVYDRERILNFRFKEDRYNRISTLYADENHIYFITDSNDLIEYDGSEFRLKKRSMLGAKTIITSACNFKDRIYIGTDRNGLYQYDNSDCRSVHEEIFENKRISCIKQRDDYMLVATDAGLYRSLSDGGFRLISGEIPISSAAFTAEKEILIGDYFANIHNIENDRSRVVAGFGNAAEVVSFILPLSAEAGAELKGSKLIGLQNDILRLSSEGLSQRVAVDNAGRGLNANFITSIAVDDIGRVWLGYFDRGIDIISPGWSAIRHMESDDVRVIRHLRYDMDRSEMYAAGSRGVLVFDQDLNYRKITTADGLINNEVSHINFTAEGGIYCTAGGVTIDKGGLLRSLYVFNNLCNNHTYSSAYIHNWLFVATLGGISRIEDLEVKENYRVLNSSLPHSWVTALVADGSGNLWIGTYGGGLACLNFDGSWEEMECPFKDFEVNNNALVIYDGLLFAGTLSEGIIIYSPEDDEWFNYRAGLPSMNVTSFYRYIDDLYVGTDAGLCVVKWDVIDDFTGR